MPIYEYQCQSCKTRFELMQRFSDPPASECPECGHTTVKKLISNTSFQLKGSGWYVTDYAKAGSSSSKGDEGKSSHRVDSDSSSSAKGDTASASKGEASGDAKASDSKGSESKSESSASPKSDTKAASGA